MSEVPLNGQTCVAPQAQGRRDPHLKEVTYLRLVDFCITHL